MKPFLSLFILLLSGFQLQAQTQNGFDLQNASIPVQEIHRGGPPRDGIPSIDAPKFIEPREADFLKPDDQVISVTVGDTTRAYPLRILIWHEIVNDQIGETAFMVTYCPLCGTSMVFDRKVDEKVRTFGVSGLLYNSDVMMFDREDASLWSQLKMEAVSGPSQGSKLKWMSSDLTTWKAWREKNPQGQVLSTDTGHRRRYTSSPYDDYFTSNQVMFPVSTSDQRKAFPDKESVIGILVKDTPKAYKLSDLLEKGTLQDRIQTEAIELTADRETRQVRVTDPNGKVIPSVSVYWFAWQAFYPNTLRWKK